MRRALRLLVTAGLAGCHWVSEEEISDARATLRLLSTGADHAVRQSPGQVPVAWGDNLVGELITPESALQQFSSDGDSRHTCGVDAAGAIRCWGSNGNGESDAPTGTFVWAGAGGTGGDYDVDGNKDPGSAHAFSCAIRESDHGITCWGEPSTQVAAVPAGHFVTMDLGATDACALSDVGEVVCWGAHSFTLDGFSGVPTAVSVGPDDACVVTDLLELRCASGATADDAETVAVGGFGACAATFGGWLYCAGAAVEGRPVGRGWEGEGVVEVSVSDTFACAISGLGVNQCWGEGAPVGTEPGRSDG